MAVNLSVCCDGCDHTENYSVGSESEELAANLWYINFLHLLAGKWIETTEKVQDIRNLRYGDTVICSHCYDKLP